MTDVVPANASPANGRITNGTIFGHDAANFLR